MIVREKIFWIFKITERVDEKLYKEKKLDTRSLLNLSFAPSASCSSPVNHQEIKKFRKNGSLVTRKGVQEELYILVVG